MRRDRIITRILLILSITNVALAAPAVVRQGDLDVADAARKRGNEASQETVSEHMSELSGSADSGSDPYFSAPESPSHPPDVDVESLDGWLPGSQAGSEHADSDTESLSGWLAQDPAPESPSGSPHENLAPPESNSIFTDYLKQKLQGKLKKLAIWGATVLISGGVTYGILKNTGVPYIVDRDAGTPMDVLTDNQQPRKNSVSRGLGKLRDEDLRLLSVLSHRVPDRLD